MAEAYSFELNPELLELLHREFHVEGIASRFAEALRGKGPEEAERIGKEIFTDYGTEWIRRTLQLGEEYPDRTYEVLKEAIDKTGGYYKFALVPQRFLEIAYLSIQDFSVLPIMENHARALVYRVPDCALYRAIQAKCGEAVAALMPCKEACLTACRILHQDLELDARIGMNATAAKDGYCEFYARKV